MLRHPSVRWLLAALFVTLAALAALLGAARLNAQQETEILSFDIVEIPSRFVFAPYALDGGDLPAYGNPFITQGYIYPAGTLDGSDGINADGSPAFPDKVLGEWTCYGFHVGAGAQTTEGPWVVTTQQFQLGLGFGERMIVSSGYELPEVGKLFRRAIVGGTGPYATAQGEQMQSFLGLTSQNSVKIRVELRVSP
jgi:hypothetical protein